MAKIVAAGAVSHTALMVRAKDKAPKEQADNVFGAFAELGNRLKEKQVDTIVVLSADHLKTFFFDNMPSICIGIGETGKGWGDAGVPQYDVPMDQPLAKHLLTYGLENEFDLSSSYEMKLDHGFMAPLHYLTPQMDIPIVPIFINAATPPISPLKRMYRFGEMIAKAIKEWDENKRVALIATGGLSHWVAVPRMGEIAEEFDHRIINQLLQNQEQEIQKWSNEEIENEAGNGALEIRSWVAVAGACPNEKRELLCYEPVAAWATGIGIMDFMGGE
jgi:aromatic ring-opening dioxygenase catalytic subunit (LigB family)